MKVMEMDNNKLREYLKTQIEKATGWDAMFTNAIDVEKIPYNTFGYKELLSEDNGKHIMELTVDTWDRDTPFHIIEKIDQLDKMFNFYKDMTETFMIQIFLGKSREFIEDEDKTIKRLQRKYDLVVYEKGV